MSELDERQIRVLKEGINEILSRWTVLSLAVEQQWGGPTTREKVKEMKEVLLSWMNGADLFEDELEELLDDFLATDFCTEAQDGSLKLVARGLLKLYNECREGKTDFLQYVKGLKVQSGSTSSIGKKSENYESDDYEDMSDDEEQEQEGGESEQQAASASTAPSSSSVPPASDAGPSSSTAQPAPSAQPQADPDGWVTVKGRKKR